MGTCFSVSRLEFSLLLKITALCRGDRPIGSYTFYLTDLKLDCCNGGVESHVAQRGALPVWY
jgi:hypothetical protein